MQIFALSFFDMTNLFEIGQMTLNEFELRKKAYLLKRIQIEEDIHLLAYLNRQAKATKKDGKTYIFKKFIDFFNKKKRIDKLLNYNTNALYSRLFEITKRVQKFNNREEENNG